MQEEAARQQSGETEKSSETVKAEVTEEKADTKEAAEADQKEKEKKTKTRPVAVSMLLWLALSLSPLLVFGIRSLIAGKATQPGEWILLSVSGLAFYFVMLLCIQNQIWRYHQGKHRRRFTLVFLAGLVLTFACSFTQPLLWLYLPLGVALLLCSDLPQAIAAYFLLLYLQMVLSSPVPEVFLCFSLIGCVGILLFSFLDDSFLFGVPLFCSLLFQTLLLLSLEFSLRGYFQPESFLYIGLNLVISFLLLTGILKYMSLHVIHKASDKYSELNDPEFELLAKLKEKNVRAYYHAVHTAHFCEKLAEKIGADVPLCKAGGYYHKIGRLRGDSNLKHALELAKEYEFPPKLVELLREYGGKNTALRSREAGIVLLSDAMVSSVMFLFEKNKDAKLNYGQIVAVVFSKQMESGYLDECRLTLEELTIIKKCFMEETLYYDFLR